MRHVLSVCSMVMMLASPALASPNICETAQSEPRLTYSYTSLPTQSLDGQQYALVPIASAPILGGEGSVTTISMIMSPDTVAHQAFQMKAVESSWLVPFTCAELDRIVQAVYARHGFYFPQPQTRAFFCGFDRNYQPRPELSVAEVEAKFTSRDQLTLLRVEMAMDSHGCASEKRAAD